MSHLKDSQGVNELCVSSYRWSSDNVTTSCELDRGHAGEHSEIRDICLYRWSESNVTPIKYEDAA